MKAPDVLTRMRQRTSRYEDLNKPDLVIALDKHLRQHQDDFDQNPNFIDYYKRLSLPPRSTPRREIKSDPSATPDRDLRMSTRRRRRPAKLISNDSYVPDIIHYYLSLCFWRAWYSELEICPCRNLFPSSAPAI